MNEIEKFKAEVDANIDAQMKDEHLQHLTRQWIEAIPAHKYTYNFSWLDRPIIQFPQDMYAMQELIWQVKPDLVIETGIAHGGSLVFSASILAMLEYAEAVENGHALDVQNPKRKVLGIDIDIRSHNRELIESNPMASRIEMIEGSSIAPEVIDAVKNKAAAHERVLVLLDSNHTHDHVAAELEAYAELVSLGSYCVVFDTAIEDVANDFFTNRPWGKGNNPKTAVWEFLSKHKEFEIDKKIEGKLLFTVAPDGYLKRTKL